MGSESRNGNGEPANDPSSVRFGWRPDAPSVSSEDGARVVLPPATRPTPVNSDSPPRSSERPNGRFKRRSRGQSNSNGSQHSANELTGRSSDTLTEVRPGQAPTIQELQPFHRSEGLTQPSRSERKQSRTVLPKIILHALVVLTITAVVAGHGYWHEIPQSAPPPTDSTRGLRLGELPTTGLTGVTAVNYTLASAGGSTQSGYISQFATAIIPERLNIQNIRSTNGQSISDIAKQTGRSIDTLLWANSLTDPAKPLAPGTELRIPPVDGMLHVIHDGDTLDSIAARYQVDVSAITDYAPNNVQSTSDLVPYRLIMVPGGKMPTRDQVVTYVVREGDSLATIAQYFGLHPNTIVWANSLPNGDLIFPGQHLAILPTDGVMVTVGDGDTVAGLADKYGVDAKDILDYPLNGLGSGGTLRTGQQVMIPGGAPPAPPPPPPAPPAPAPQTQTTSAAPTQSQPAPAAPQAATGSFIWPTNGTITQYFGPTSFWMEPAYAGYAHFHQGLDIANSAYTPIVAADSGTVVFAGWNTSGYGYAVSINHGNGLVTWYGHMAEQPAVWVGEQVSQGQYLGPMGSTGASSGAHLHFGVLRNGVWDNPLKYLP